MNVKIHHGTAHGEFALIRIPLDYEQVNAVYVDGLHSFRTV